MQFIRDLNRRRKSGSVGWMHEGHSSEIAHAIRELACAVREHSHFTFATKQDLETSTNKIMSAISDFAAKQTAFNDRLDAAISGLQGDIKTLNDLIEKLQTTPGPISPEDQATLDQLESRGDALATKLEALDSQTPPPVPTA